MEHNHLNKLSITFQQKDQCEIWWKLAKWFLKNHDLIHVNSTVAGKYYKYKSDDGRGSKFEVKCQHRIIILAILVDLLSPIICAKIRTQGLFGYGEEDF